jgi:hypothetical protein
LGVWRRPLHPLYHVSFSRHSSQRTISCGHSSAAARPAVVRCTVRGWRVLPAHCFTCCTCAKERLHSPPSNETSSMSEVTEILCAVSSGDFEGAASSLGVSVVVSASLGRAGTSGTGESALPSCGVEAAESGLLRRERDERGRSECESGRGVISDASSKLSCRNTPVSGCSCGPGRATRRPSTHALSVGTV